MNLIILIEKSVRSNIRYWVSMTLFWQCLLILAVSGISNLAWANVATTWKTLQPGLAYTKIAEPNDSPDGYIHAFKLDLNHYQLKVSGVPKNSVLPEENFKQLWSINPILLAINGGFFTPELQPLGLRITGYKQTNPIKNISWWSIFFVKNKEAAIIPPSAYYPDTQIEFAIQAGPRLIINGAKTQGLNGRVGARTALGITRDHQIILLTTENLFLSTDALAEIMRKSLSVGGLDCLDAINLDGGHSAQMYASFSNFSLAISNQSAVADAVVVAPR